MKYIYFTAILFISLTYTVSAQTNTFPSSGNVGIGTTSPLQALQIGDLTESSTATPKAIDLGGTYSNTPGTNLKLRLYNDGNYIGGFGISAGQIDYKLWNSSASHVFYQGTTELMRIKGDGYVGVGTANPSQKLEVNGKMAVNNGIIMTGIPGAGGDYNLIHNDNSSSTVGFLAGNGVFYASSGPYVGARGNTYTSIAGQRGLLFLCGGAVNSPIGREGSIAFMTTPGAGTEELQRMIIKRDGNIGIATADPTEKLDVSGNIKATGLILPTGAAAGKVLTSDANGNGTWQTGGTSSGWAFNGSAVSTVKSFGTLDNYDLPFITNNTEQMRILVGGSVVIGTTSLPSSDAKLAVNGNIYSTKVKVTQSGWADYVFHANYRLRPLSEVEKYIRQHQHLPEVPSAAEVERNGIDLGDNQTILLKKIEELTLYIIEQNKRLSALEKKLRAK